MTSVDAFEGVVITYYRLSWGPYTGAVVTWVAECDAEGRWIVRGTSGWCLGCRVRVTDTHEGDERAAARARALAAALNRVYESSL